MRSDFPSYTILPKKTKKKKNDSQHDFWTTSNVGIFPLQKGVKRKGGFPLKVIIKVQVDAV